MADRDITDLNETINLALDDAIEKIQTLRADLERARNLALAVLIYHDPYFDPGDDTFVAWTEAAGTADCSPKTLCKLARKVLEDTNV